MTAKESEQSGVPSPEHQSWGTLIAIVVIVLMIIIGAFYAGSSRFFERQWAPAAVQASATTTVY